MSFLRKLFRGKTPEERVAEAERYLAGDDPGMARLELEALAGSALEPALAARVGALLEQARTRLASARIADARTHLEAGDVETAATQAALAVDLAQSEALRGEAEAVLAEVKAARHAAGSDEGDDEDEDEDEDEPEDEGEEGRGEGGPEADPDPDPEPPAAEGDEHLDPLEEALLAFPEEESTRLRALNALEPRVGEALVCRGAGDAGRALELLAGLTREPFASDPLLRRERGATALLAGQVDQAVDLLAPLHLSDPEDPVLTEHLLHARLARGEREPAVDLALALLDLGAQDPATVHAVLLQAGRGDDLLAHLERALGRSPDDLPALAAKAAALRALGREEEARATAQRGERIARSRRAAGRV